MIYIVPFNPLTDDLIEEYVKRLIGRTDVEDALGRLDRLMQDEVRMVAAQDLKATHGVSEKVQCVDDRVQDVDEKVQGVDDKMDLVIYGAQLVSNQSLTSCQWYSMLSG